MVAMADAAAIVIDLVDGLNTLIDYRYQQHFKAPTAPMAWARTAMAPMANRSC